VSALQAEGHTVYAPSLSGLGDRHHLLSEQTSLTTHINDVANLLQFERLEDVVLVGHSYGGAVITGVLGRHPTRIARMVYVDAYVLEPGQACLDILPHFRDPLDEMAAKHNGLYLDPMDPAAFGVVDGAEVRWIEERSTLMPYAPVKDPLPAPCAESKALEKPTTYVSCTGLGLFIDTAAKAREWGWDVHDVNTHHYVQVSQPATVVSVLNQSVT
jgi:pimeloyl-ACP methyl ester carboxylesterase